MTTLLVRDDTERSLPTVQPSSTAQPSPVGRLLAVGAVVEARLKASFQRWSVHAARVSLGAIFFAFGILKYFPDVSPAEPLVVATFDKLTFGLVTGTAAMIITATAECLAGAALILGGRLTRLGLAVFAVCEVGILSPLVLLPDMLFTSHGPTLAGQYVLKNVVLIAAALVVASRALRGPDEHH